MNIESVVVFCGSKTGQNPLFMRHAAELGKLIAVLNLRLVYGGGNVGLMGVVADTVLSCGGEVVGVMPQHLVDREIAHGSLTELRIVASMHERKALMGEMSDAFVALPGGLGTLEEFFEVWTWGQLGLHRKPYGLLNVDGFFDPLLIFLDKLVTERFLKPESRGLVTVAEEPAQLLDALAAREITAAPRWFDRAVT